jgi:hypothetical protein
MSDRSHQTHERIETMIITNRRTFLLHAAVAGSALSVCQVRAQTFAKLAETDAQAMALGYRMDTTQVDAKKYPQHTASQECTTCLLFQGKPGDAAAGCSLFSGKQVMATGWCSAWNKRA